MNERPRMVWERLPVGVRVAVTLFYVLVAVIFLAAIAGTISLAYMAVRHAFY